MKLHKITLVFTFWLFISGGIWAKPENVTVVNAKYVCMTQDKIFDRELIPIRIQGNVYYGCCNACVMAMKSNPEKYIYAVDPISKRIVDKSKSIILNFNGTALYFENRNHVNKFISKIK